MLLDEPTNDVDTDMLTATEDLLDSWPGTLVVVSHDRYLLERVTDQQYAILDGRLRHLPGGIDQYLRLAGPNTPRPPSEPRPEDQPSGRRQCLGRSVVPPRRNWPAADRQLARLTDRIAAKHTELAEHDQSDHVALTRLTQELRDLEDELAATESRWLELSEVLE